MTYSNYGFIFDMDGTLVDNMHFHARAWQTMLAENDLAIDGEEFLKKTAGKTNREIIPAYFPDATDEELLKLGDRKETLYREIFLPERKTVAGAVDFLTRSKELGIKMAVATAAPVANMEFILDGLDLRRFFTAITTAADVSNGKPDPEVFLISAEKLGVEPENCIVFEDAFNGFEAAHRAGIKSIGISTVNAPETLRALPSVIDAFPDFSALAPENLIERISGINLAAAK
ncbi:MAG: HAD family phosphatase [Pyrinomonadaceae bacterium]|nr:HAD family phosphatase [Pyrinomonadaceae bacterium]